MTSRFFVEKINEDGDYKIVTGKVNLTQVATYFRDKHIRGLTSTRSLRTKFGNTNMIEEGDYRIRKVNKNNTNLTNRDVDIDLKNNIETKEVIQLPDKYEIDEKGLLKRIERLKGIITKDYTDIPYVVDHNNIDDIIIYIMNNIKTRNNHADEEKRIRRNLYQVNFKMQRDNETFTVSTKFQNYNDLFENIIDLLLSKLHQYNDLQILKFQIINSKLDEIDNRIVFGASKYEFLQKMLRKIANRKDKKNILSKYENFFKKYHVINPHTNKNCIIKALFISFEKSEEVDDKVKKFSTRIIGKDETKRTIKYICDKFSQEKNVNIKVIDLMNFEEKCYVIDKELDVVKIGFMGSHSYALIKKDKPSGSDSKKKLFKNAVVFNSDEEQDIMEAPEYKNNHKDYTICTYDIETTTIPNIDINDKKVNCKAYALGYYDGKKYTEFFENPLYYANIIEFFLNHIKSKSTPTNQILYAHNGGKFDLWYVIKYILKRKDFHITNILQKEGRIINLTVRCNFDLKKTIKFRDSFCFFATSLDKACQDFKTEIKKLEGEVDHSKITYVEHPNCYKYDSVECYNYVKNYLKHDCLSLHELLIKYDNLVNTKWNFSIKEVMTNASIAKRIFFSKYYDDFDLYTIPPTVDSLFRKYYFGGRNECFNTLGLLIKKLYYYDFTSLYPYCMDKYKYPHGKYELLKINSYNEKYNGLYKIKVKHTTKAILTEETPYLPIVYNNKLVFPLLKDWTDMIVTSEQIKYILKRNLGYEIIYEEVYHYKKFSNIFKEMTSEIYKLKLKASIEKNASLKSTAKQIINSLYGFFGTKTIREQMEIVRNKLDNSGLAKKYAYINNLLLSGNLLNVVDDKDSRYVIYSFEDTVDIPGVNVGIAMFVTSYARTELYELMYQIKKKGKNVYYCDTDSVITDLCIEDDKKLFDKYMKGGKDVLGNLKNEIGDVEGTKDLFFDKAVFLGCKTYCLVKNNCLNENKELVNREVVKFKGINTKNKYVEKYIKDQNIYYNNIDKFKGKYKLSYDDFVAMSSGFNVVADNLSFLGNNSILYNNNTLKKFDNQKRLEMQYTKANVDKFVIRPLVVPEPTENDLKNKEKDRILVRKLVEDFKKKS